MMDRPSGINTALKSQKSALLGSRSQGGTAVMAFGLHGLRPSELLLSIQTPVALVDLRQIRALHKSWPEAAIRQTLSGNAANLAAVTC